MSSTAVDDQYAADRDAVIDREEMLKLMAIMLDDWPRDCDDFRRNEPGGGWIWYDVPPDCEFVLGVPDREGREWCITEQDWMEARWGAGEERMEAIGSNGATGAHYAEDSDAESALSQLPDAINPSHYRAGKVECIDALEAATVNKSGIEAVCTANAIKYLWRYESKGGAEDVRKARWYIERLLKALEDSQ